MNINYKVSYNFVRLPDAAIPNFTDTVITALTGNTGFPTLPVTLTELGTLKSTYVTKLMAMAQGGTLATAEKNAAKAALLDALRQVAAYVQSVASQDLALLLSSGFENTNTNRAQSPLLKPEFLALDNSFNAKLIVRLKPVSNARAYEVQYKNGGGWLPAGIFTQGRRVEVGGLTSGNSYTVQVRAIGGSTGYSDWTTSEPVIVT